MKIRQEFALEKIKDAVEKDLRILCRMKENNSQKMLSNLRLLK
ncbi:hypothetical protein CWI36_3542p0010, partial [Hamiltosporidium magnivora]